MRWLLSSAAAVLTTVVVFDALVRVLRPDWTSSEHVGLAVWTLPLLPLLLLVGKYSRALRHRRSRSRRIALVCGLGAVLGIAFAFAMYFATGAYVLAFDVSPLWPLVGGAIAGLAVTDWLDQSDHTARAPTAAA